jgi:hypothetical protein
MKQCNAVGAALAMAVLSGTVALAQVKTMAGERVTETGTVEAIDYTARVMTLKDETGELTTIDVPKEVKRFDAIKVGDKVSATYYDSVSVRLKEAGEKAVDKDTMATTPTAGTKPGAVIATQRTMTATIEAIDPKVPSISFKGPGGWKYNRKVLDKDVLKKVKVGDQVDFIWTDAVEITVLAPKK